MQGYLKGKEKNGINYFNTDLEYEFEIGETSVQEMGTDGNVFVQNHKVHLEKNNIQLTKDYWDIVELWDDHYAVCDLSVSNCYLDGLNQYTLKSELEALGPKFGPKINFKYGVIRLKRNDKGEVIPFAEKMIVPIVYDRICENNDDSLTAYSNGKLTYIELDPRSLNYGKQLIPAVLEHAVAFSLKYQGFAECSVDGITAKTAKTVVSSAIPVVGKILGDAVDTVLGCGIVLKNAVGIVGVIIVIGICIMPIIKLSILFLSYKLLAIVSEPIADKNIVGLLEQIGDIFKIFFGIICALSFMLIIGTSLVLKMSNSSVMYR